MISGGVASGQLGPYPGPPPLVSGQVGVRLQPAPPPVRRLHFTIPELVEEQRIPRSSVMRALRENRVRHRRRGRQYLLHPDDVEREWGFPEEHEPEASPEAKAFVRRLLS